MKKSLKIFIWILLISIVIPISLIATITVVIDPNDYKDSISEYIEKETGLLLTIGDIQWKIWPLLGFKISEVNLVMQDNIPLANIQELTTYIDLISLFKLKPEVNQFYLNKVRIHSLINHRNEHNWDPLIEYLNENKTATNNQSVPAETSDAASPIPINIYIQKFSLSDAELKIMHQPQQIFYSLEDFSLQSNKINFEQPFPIQLTFSLKEFIVKENFSATLKQLFDWTTSTAIKPLINTKVSGDFQVSATLDQFSTPNLAIVASLPAAFINPNQIKTDISATININVDIAKDTLELKQLVVQAPANCSLGLGLTIHSLSTLPTLNGNWQIPSCNIRKLLQTYLGIDLTTIPKEQFNELTSSGKFTGSSELFKIPTWGLKFDESNLSGHFTWYNNTENQEIDFQFKADTISISNYLPPASRQINAENEPPPNDIDSNSSNTTIVSPLSLPFSVLPEINLSIIAKVNQLSYEGFLLEDFVFEAARTDHKLLIDQLNAKLLGGTIAHTMQINAAPNTNPSAKIVSKWQQVEVKPVITHFVTKSDSPISGQISLQKTLLTKGKTISELQQQLTGNGQFSLAQATLHGTNLNQWLSQNTSPLLTNAALLIKEKAKQQNIQVKDPAMLRKDTLLAEVSSSFQIHDEKIHFETLTANLQKAFIDGQGYIEWLESLVDIEFIVAEEQKNEIPQSWKDVSIPVLCQGSWMEAASLCKLHKEKLTDQINSIAKKVAQQKINKKKQELKEKAKKKEQQVKQKAKKKEQEAKKKVDKKIKEKIPDSLQKELKKYKNLF